MLNNLKILSKIKSYFNPSSKIEEIIYNKALLLSREKKFYIDFLVPDTIDGRFDMLCLIVSIFMIRIKQIGRENFELKESCKEINQKLFDAFFTDMDLTLREMGVGDIGVSSRVKKMSEAFMGRLNSYTKALEKRDFSHLEKSIARNVYRRTIVKKVDQELSKKIYEIYDNITHIEKVNFLDSNFNIKKLI